MDSEGEVLQWYKKRFGRAFNYYARNLGWMIPNVDYQKSRWFMSFFKGSERVFMRIVLDNLDMVNSLLNPVI